jgi:hypothetical protein
MRTLEESEGDNLEVGVIMMVCFLEGEATVGGSFFTMLDWIDVVDREWHCGIITCRG